MKEGAGFAQTAVISLFCSLGLMEVVLGQIPVFH